MASARIKVRRSRLYLNSVASKHVRVNKRGTVAVMAPWDSLQVMRLENEESVTPRPGWDVARILVTVKAYPAIARTSGESVCVAGVRLDTPVREWIRLFPVGFRVLPKERQFEKYQVISLRVRRGATDRRAESFKPDLESLVLGEKMGTERHWRRRWEIVDPLAGATTTCALARRAAARGQAAPSLGLIKPRKVTDLTVDENPLYRPGGSAELDVDLFGTEREVLEATPFVVRYRYLCMEPECSGHDQSIVDWESGQLARRNLANHPPEEAAALHRERFLDQMCGPGRDTYFYVGNQHQHPRSFLVLGVFWPPQNSRPQPTLPF